MNEAATKFGKRIQLQIPSIPLSFDALPIRSIASKEMGCAGKKFFNFVCSLYSAQKE
jgi:hypothetical protein